MLNRIATEFSNFRRAREIRRSRIILALLNRKNVCFSMLLQRLLLGFKRQNKPESRSFMSGVHCELAASTLNSIILDHFKRFCGV